MVRAKRYLSKPHFRSPIPHAQHLVFLLTSSRSLCAAIESKLSCRLMAWVVGGTAGSCPLNCNKIEKTMMKKELAYSRVSEAKLRAINLNLLPILRGFLRFHK